MSYIQANLTARRKDLIQWLIDALNANMGSTSISKVCKHIWIHHEDALRKSGNLFFTWQYDIRWTATNLRKNHVLKPARLSPRGIWELV